MTRQNLELILGLFKEGQIGEKEAADLIEDLANRSSNYWWSSPNTIYPSYTEPQKFEITCRQYESNQVSQM
jgi:hypothetical protein